MLLCSTVESMEEGKSSLNIKNSEAHALARELADATGQSMTQAVIGALREALRMTERGAVPRLDTLEAIAEHCASLPLQDDRPADAILGYDEQGMPS